MDRMMDVGGRLVAVHTVGSGSPAVVCISSLGGGHHEWAEAVQLLAQHSTIVTYGRPALDGSDPLPPAEANRPRSAGWAATELRQVLQQAEIPPPYLIATGSIGAWIGDRYAATWPDEVAGLVLIDPTNITPFPDLDVERELSVDEDNGGVRFSRQLTIPEMLRHVPAGLPPRNVVLSSAEGRWLRNDPSPWHAPLSLEDVERHWRVMQAEWVDRLGAHHIVAHTAGHLVHMEAPALAVHVVEAVLRAARADQPLLLDELELDRVGGRWCRDHAGSA